MSIFIRRAYVLLLQFCWPCCAPFFWHVSVLLKQDCLFSIFRQVRFSKHFFLRSVWCRVSSKLLRTTWLDVAAAGGANADFVVQELDRLPGDECVHSVLIPLMPYNGRNNHLSVALAFVTESIFLYEYKFGEHFAYYALWRCEFVLLRHFLHFPLCRRISISFQTSVIFCFRDRVLLQCLWTVDGSPAHLLIIAFLVTIYYFIIYNLCTEVFVD